ncbi:SRPBCC family protein [Pseudochryseolinea flava]|nr:SRPBCC domain-containing protein [Pseudochryseolinea flava]
MKTIEKDLIARSTITIQAPVERVWEALVTPALVKQYLHGTDVESDWKVGSSVIFRGEWKGKSYEDKGEIKAIEKNKRLQYSFWSSLAGKEDSPANYVMVTYDLLPTARGTELTISADDPNADEQTKKHMEQNWDMVLQSLQKLLEATT